jgi:hypothetical protein
VSIGYECRLHYGGRATGPELVTRGYRRHYTTIPSDPRHTCERDGSGNRGGLAFLSMANDNGMYPARFNNVNSVLQRRP